MTHYITKLRDDANNRTQHPNVEWFDSSYHNDACDSISADVDSEGEWYVQLFAFESKEAAQVEEFDAIYATRIVKNGEDDWHNPLVIATDDMSEALSIAIEAAEKMQGEYLAHKAQDGGFEYDGVWIEDRTKSPCGRFDLTPEQSDEIYGKTTN
jgi:hypothetical protein